MKPNVFDVMGARRFWTLLLMLPLSILWSKEDKSSLEISGTAIAVNATIAPVKLSVLGSEAAGANFEAYNALRLITEPKGLVKLYYPLSLTDRPVGEATVSVQIDYLALVNDKLEAKSTIVALNLKMSAALMKNVDLIELPQAVKIISTKVLTVLYTGAFPSIKLAHEVSAQTYVPLGLVKPQTLVSGFALTHSAALLQKNGTLDITWTAIPTAESYELEWTYVSDISATYTVDNTTGKKVFTRLEAKDVEVKDYLFRHNSSRVNTVNTTYSIPMVYEQGLILYRLRAIGKNQVGGKAVEVKSLWTQDENFTKLSSFEPTNIYTFDGLEQNLNWQSSISYAEEGKNKSVVSYHDGSSRNRQAVTKINTDQRAIVGETMYDYNGRPQLQTLPVPVTRNDLNYRPHFNLIEGKWRIEKSQYDIATEGNGCDVLAPQFRTDSGASNYYSPMNHFDNDPLNVGRKLLNKDLIPDAKKYPYTQTYYTNDNTGRIASQSGVGENHLIGSGHETKYLYGSPDQPEITRLFGTDVGNAAHYKKNVVIDPNGQVSVSYLDMDGKVIATALSGGSPDNVTQLDGDPTRTINANMLDNVSYPLDSSYNYKEYRSTFAVGEEAKYKFIYSGQVGGYAFSCTDKKTNAVKTVNLAGVVDVEFKLIDKCKKTLINSFASTTYSTASSASQTINMPIVADGSAVAGEVNLKPGQYDVIKRVSINQQKLDQYWQYYSTSTQYNCVLTNDSLVKAEKNKIALQGCEVTCDSCKAQTARLLANTNVPKTTEERYRIEHMCNNLCSDNAKCLSGLNPMLADLNPDGQYGQIRPPKVAQANINGPDKSNFDQSGVNYNGFESSVKDIADNPDDVNIDPSPFPMSIFNNNNRLRAPQLPLTNNTACFSSVKASWQHPVRIYFNDAAEALAANKVASQDSYTNEVLFDGDKNFANAVYVENDVDYRDPAGNIVYATVKLQGNSYVPGVINPGKVIPVSVANNAYKVPIRYLSDVRDFLPHWQPHFANYLVVYHPEFRYFVECTSNKKSNTFERQLLSIADHTEAKQKGLLDNNNLPILIVKDSLCKYDPIAKQYLTSIYNKYKDINTTTPADYKKMNEIVTKSIDCPASSDQCMSNTSQCYNGQINTKEKWLMLVSLYLAERQKYEHLKITQIAVNKAFFNGCIGDKNYLWKDDARKFFIPRYTSTPTVQIDLCRYRFWWGYTKASPCCKEVPRTSGYWYFNRPMYDMTQTCSVWESGLYSDKVRRFEPTQDMVNNGLSLNESNCTATIDALEGQPAMVVETPCNSQVEDYINRGLKAAEALKYEKCGLCPVATDLEQLLIAAKKKSFFSSNVKTLISCVTDAAYLPTGATLQKQFQTSTNTLYPKLYWKAVLSGNDKVLTITLTNEVTAPTITQTITLTMPTLDPSKTFADINFCCLNTNAATPNSFKLKGTYYTDRENKRIEFDIEGASTVALTPCTFPPSCNVTSKASDVSNLLNVLLMQDGSDKAKQLQLATAADEVALINNIYEPILRMLLNKTALDDTGAYAQQLSTYTPKWKATIASSGSNQILNGKITMVGTTPAQIDVIIIPTVSGSISNFNDIERFANLRAFSESCGDGTKPINCENTKFVADAVVTVGGVKTFKEVTIQVAQMTMSICRPVIFAKQ